LIGTSLCVVALVTLGLATGSVELWVAQWSFFALSELLIKPTVWLAIVTRMFRRSRGLATAVTLSGTAGALTFAPLVCYELIYRFGWRDAYMLLGAGWGGLALLLTALFFHDRAVDAEPSEPNVPPIPLDGLTMREVVRSITLIRIAVALMLATTISVAVVNHKVAILHELGISRSAAALIAGTTGIASVVGSIATGWLYDRSSSNWIGVAALGSMTLGFLLLLLHIPSTPLVVLAMILFGLSSGATLQATMYLTAQYGGARNFGKIFGIKASLTAIGISAGPLLGGVIYDRTGSYFGLFVLGVVLGLVSALLMFRLGPYPDWASVPGRSRSGIDSTGSMSTSGS
jgi:predicted MFS family arabinose efflux permease